MDNIIFKEQHSVLEKEIFDLESKISIELPFLYKEFILSKGIGPIKPRLFKVPQNIRKELNSDVVIVEGFHLLSEIEEGYKEMKEYLAPHSIIDISYTIGDNLFCIGYAKYNYGMMYYYTHDLDVIPLNVSFRDFVNLLHYDNKYLS